MRRYRGKEKGDYRGGQDVDGRNKSGHDGSDFRGRSGHHFVISVPAAFTDRSGISFFDLSSTPGTSVKSKSRLAFNAPATAPAKVSALTLKVCPVFEVASGASTGMRSWPISWFSSVRSTFSGSPTKPRSTTFSIFESGSTMLDRKSTRLNSSH